MSSRFHFSVPVLVASVIVGCGGGDAPVDPNAAVEGRALRRASELEGVWLGLTEGTFLGLEFMDDGQALATLVGGGFGGPGQALYNYSVLDDGRLALVGINGAGQEVYTTNIDGDRLEIESFINKQRFMRLPEGQTLEQGLEEQLKLREAQYQERYDALTAFLSEPGLVIAPTTPAPGGPAAMAVVRASIERAPYLRPKLRAS